MCYSELRKGKKKKEGYLASEIQNRSVHQGTKLEIQAIVLKAILKIPLFQPFLAINQRYKTAQCSVL